MRVTSQIDALTTMAVNPIQYLVVPRVIAGLVMLPCLTDVCGGRGDVRRVSGLHRHDGP